jgi:hypothetical protein
VVVVWGAAQSTVPDQTVVDGGGLSRGDKLVALLRQFDGNEISKAAAKDALERLEDFRATAWQDA